MGTVILSNESSTEVAILDEVRLGNPQGLAVEQAYVLPALEEVNFGGGFALPPLVEGFPYPHQDEQWAARDAVAGFEIGPGDARNLLIGLGWTGSCGGTAAWVEVDYSVGNNEFTAVSDTAFELIPVDAAVCP